MGSLYLKNPIFALLLSVLFSFLSAFFQPLLIFAGAGMALHFLLNNYRLAGAIFLSSAITLWFAFKWAFQQDETILALQYDALWIVFFFYLPLALSALVLGKTNNQATATTVNAVSAIVLLTAVTLWGQSYLQNIREFLLSLSAQNVQFKIEDVDSLVAVIAPSIGISLFLFLTASLFVARLWQSRAFKPGGFGEEFRRFKLGKPISVGLTLILALGFLNLPIVENWIMIPFLLLALQGLSILHFFAKQKQVSKSLMIGFYLLFLLVLPLFFAFVFVIVILLLVILSCIDNWVDFRSRYSTP